VLQNKSVFYTSGGCRGYHLKQPECLGSGVYPKHHAALRLARIAGRKRHRALRRLPKHIGQRHQGRFRAAEQFKLQLQQRLAPVRAGHVAASIAEHKAGKAKRRELLS
jgi:hypothetical protein